jgi:cold shock CspA family protein
MGRSQESFHKKEVRKKKDKRRKEKEQKRLKRKEKNKRSGPDDMIAYVNEEGMITSTPPDPGQKETINADGIEISIPKRGKDGDPDLVRKGKVTFFNESKGIGFIKDSETQEKVFVHVNNVLEEIKENSIVNFERIKGRKGPSAINVRLVK